MTLSPRVRTALVLGGIVLALAIIIVRGDRAPASDTIVAWSGSGAALQDPSAYAESAPGTAETPYAPSGSALDTALLATRLGTAPQSGGTQSGAFDSFLDDLLRTPQTFSADTSSTAVADAIRDAFAAVPQFPLQFSSGGEAQARTPEQEAIFAYGNRAGSIIKRYEAEHADAVQLLAAQSADRTSASKAQALRTVGAAIAKIGTDIRALEGLPENAIEQNATFAERYEKAGGLLTKLADANDDQTYLAAINAYNASVSALIEQHIAMVTYFSLAGVHFSSTDGGSVFSFSGFGAF